MPSVDERTETLELLNKEVSERLARLTASGAQVDTKSALLAGVAATATQFLATRPASHPVFAALAFSAFALSFITAVAAYAVSRHHDVPDPRALVSGFVSRTKAEALASLVATRTVTFERNLAKHKRKIVLWWVSVGGLTAGLVLSTIAIVQNTTP